MNRNTRCNQKPILKLATFNVHGGLNNNFEREKLFEDMNHHSIGVMCLQEMKINKDMSFINSKNQAFYGFTSRHNTNPQGNYSLGFLISESWTEYEPIASYINDRMCKIEFTALNSRGKQSKIVILNIYAPTLKVSTDNPSIADQFYIKLLEEYKRARGAQGQMATHVFVCGDCNAKIGQKLNNETFMGNYSRGLRNANGDKLANFCKKTNLFLANTAFRLPLRKISTWHGVDRNGRNIHNLIDYVMIPRKYQKILKSARAFNGTQKESDHSLVVTELYLKDFYKPRRYNTIKKPLELHISELANLSSDVRERYQEALTKNLSELEADILTYFDAGSPNYMPEVRYREIRVRMDTAARETIPAAPVIKNSRLFFHHDEILKQMSKQNQKLRHNIKCSKNVSEKTKWRIQRKKIRSEINKRIKNLYLEYYDMISDRIASGNRGRSDYEVPKFLNRAPRKPFKIHNEASGVTHITPQIIIPIIIQHYEKAFNNLETNQDVPFQAFNDDHGILDPPILVEEVAVSLKRLKNNKSAGIDGLKSELFKYGCENLALHITVLLNSIFNKHEDLKAIGEGILITLNKPNKSETIENTRPIVLLNTIRKILSTILLNRIRPILETYISVNQSGFQPNRSTADVVASFKWQMAITQKYDEIFIISGIDIKKAFDGISREKLMNICEHECNFSKTNLRLLRYLLANTTLTPKVRHQMGTAFQTTIGTPQGDCLSPVLFIIYLESILKSFHNPGTIHPALPAWPAPQHPYTEMQYADDVYFCQHRTVETNRTRIQSSEITPIIDTLRIHTRAKDLDISLEKSTHFIINRRLDRAKSMEILGCKIGNAEDIAKRITKANSLFQDLSRLWNKTRRDARTITMKIRLYNSLIVPILLYNGGTLALTEALETQLNICHRKHLRIILGVKYDDRISNSKIYEITKTNPLSINLCKLRWSLLRKIIQNDNSPCYKLIRYYFEEAGKRKNKYRRKTSLPQVLSDDMDRISDDNEIYKFNLDMINRLESLNVTDWNTLKRKLVLKKSNAVYNKLLTDREKQANRGRKRALWRMIYVISVYILVVLMVCAYACIIKV